MSDAFTKYLKDLKDKVEDEEIFENPASTPEQRIAHCKKVLEEAGHIIFEQEQAIEKAIAFLSAHGQCVMPTQDFVTQATQQLNERGFRVMTSTSFADMQEKAHKYETSGRSGDVNSDYQDRVDWFAKEDWKVKSQSPHVTRVQSERIDRMMIPTKAHIVSKKIELVEKLFAQLGKEEAGRAVQGTSELVSLDQDEDFAQDILIIRAEVKLVKKDNR